MDAMGSIFESVNLAIESLEGICSSRWFSLPIQKEEPNVKSNDCCWCEDMLKEEETTNIRTNQPLAESLFLSLSLHPLLKTSKFVTLYMYTATQGLGNLTKFQQC